MLNQIQSGETARPSFQTFNPDRLTFSEPPHNDIDTDRIRQAASVLQIPPEELSAALATHKSSSVLNPLVEPPVRRDSLHRRDKTSVGGQELRFGQQAEAGGALDDFGFDTSWLFPNLELDTHPDIVAASGPVDLAARANVEWRPNQSLIPRSFNWPKEAFAFDPVLVPLQHPLNESGLDENRNGGLHSVPSQFRPEENTSIIQGIGNGLLPEHHASSGILDGRQMTPNQTRLIASNATRDTETGRSHAATAPEAELPPDVLHAVMSGPCSRVWELPPKPVSFYPRRVLALSIRRVVRSREKFVKMVSAIGWKKTKDNVYSVHEALSRMLQSNKRQPWSGTSLHAFVAEFKRYG